MVEKENFWSEQQLNEKELEKILGGAKREGNHTSSAIMNWVKGVLHF